MYNHSNIKAIRNSVLDIIYIHNGIIIQLLMSIIKDFFGFWLSKYNSWVMLDFPTRDECTYPSKGYHQAHNEQDKLASDPVKGAAVLNYVTLVSLVS